MSRKPRVDPRYPGMIHELGLQSNPGYWRQLHPNFKWHWDNYTKAGESSYSVDKATGAPVFADNNFAAITVFDWAAKGKDWAFSALKHGQRHNPPVQSIYDQYYNELGYPNFWLMFATASSSPGYPIDRLQGHIQWQRANKPDTIQNAKQHWDEYVRNRSGKMHLFWCILFLLYGQAHNDEVMRMYRLGFDRPNRFMEHIGF